MRIFCESTRASADRIRCVSSLWPISSEKNSTGKAGLDGDVRGDAEGEGRVVDDDVGGDEVVELPDTVRS